MFDGKTFFPVTGMPMRKMACMSRLFALADPVPLTVPILKAKSLMPDVLDRSDISAPPRDVRAIAFQRTGSAARIGSCPTLPSDTARRRDHNAGTHPHPSP